MKKRVLCDTKLLLLASVCAVVHSVAIIWTMFGLIHEETVADPTEVIQIRLLFGSLLLVLWIALVASSPRFLCTVTLSKTAITVWLPFRKKETFSYKQFRFVYCGGYFHGNVLGMGKNIWYIVIAQRRLTTNELTNINHVSNSKEVVKIRYTPKNYETIRNVLPASHIHQLNCAIAEQLSR